MIESIVCDRVTINEGDLLRRTQLDKSVNSVASHSCTFYRYSPSIAFLRITN